MDDTLYHYCPVATFASIIKNDSIWLSSLSLSNDYMEGKLAKETFDRLLRQSGIIANDRCSASVGNGHSGCLH